jgi:hypothetical protein
MVRPAFVIHSLLQAKAALAAAAERGAAVALLSAPGAAAYAGAGWFDAVARAAKAAQPDADMIAILDCSDRADLVQAAFRQGLGHAIFRGEAGVARRLRDIARQRGATLLTRRPPALDLEHAADPRAACRAWLDRGLHAHKGRGQAARRAGLK